MRWISALVATLLLCAIVNAQSIPTTSELSKLNQQAIAINTANIVAVNDRVDQLEKKCEENACRCDTLSTSAKSPDTVGTAPIYDMPDSLTDSEDMEDTIDKLQEAVRVAELTERLQRATNKLKTGSSGSVSSRVVSVGPERVTAVNGVPVSSSAPLGTVKMVNGRLRQCFDPNCTDPTCPNKQVSFSTSFSSPVRYTSSSPVRWSTRTVRSVRNGRRVCDGNQCWIEYD